MVNTSGLFTVALAGFSALAAAQPHGKQLHQRHRDLHARDAEVVMVTATIYVDQAGHTVYPTPASSPAEDDVNFNVDNYVAPSATSSAEEVAIATAVTASSSSVQAASSSSSSSSYNAGTSKQTSGTGVSSDFPDGETSCSDFPSDYGAVPVNWLNFGGWSGIQINGGNGDQCTEGALCSYACPPGYSKAQWPETQPSSGESHGGLLCKGGKLHLTRTSYPKLCEAGVGTATVVSKLQKEVAICRTDYPGTEDMVVPLSCEAGSTQSLTVPDSSNSYVWQGKQTSAQYYVNPAGISVTEGCVWSTEGSGKGNWSPIVLGAGYSDDKTWLSISQNQLNSDPLNFNIKIEGGSQECKFENGEWTGGSNGCTVAVTSGTGRIVLY